MQGLTFRLVYCSGTSFGFKGDKLSSTTQSNVFYILLVFNINTNWIQFIFLHAMFVKMLTCGTNLPHPLHSGENSSGAAPVFGSPVILHRSCTNKTKKQNDARWLWPVVLIVDIRIFIRHRPSKWHDNSGAVVSIVAYQPKACWVWSRP